jgi:hypothetical protein
VIELLILVPVAGLFILSISAGIALGHKINQWRRR